jgi:Asp/Glu/hydantoin racemase
VPRIVWQGFTSSVATRAYAERLTAYLNEVADPGFEFAFSGIDPPDLHVHRLTELRCSVQAVAGALACERDGADAIVFGHFQDAGLWELRSALTIPVVGLGESSMLYACQLGFRFGLITIDPTFVAWHEEQLRRYALTGRCAGVRAMHTPVELYMQAFAGDDDAVAAVAAQFEEVGRQLVAAGAEVLVPAGGLPALLVGTRHGYTIDGAVVLNANAVAAKQAEVAVKMRELSGLGASRRSTFAAPSAAALDEFVTLTKT